MSHLLLQGLNGLGQTAITAQQFKALCHRYADPDHANQILWKAFTHDVDIGTVNFCNSKVKSVERHLMCSVSDHVNKDDSDLYISA